MGSRARSRRLSTVLLALASLTVVLPATLASPAASGAADPAASPLFEPRPLVQPLPEDAYETADVYEDWALRQAYPPTVEPTIRPGRELVIDQPNSTFDVRCTMNFVYEDADTGDYYVGTAGHCLLPDHVDNSTEEGFEQPAVKVCVRYCMGAGGVNVTSEYTELGEVLYARQEHEGHQLGHDYGFLAVPEEKTDYLEPRVPVWGGPSQQRGQVLLGEQVSTYGQGAGFGEAEMDARSGIAVGHVLGGEGSFASALPASPGDSGGPILSGLDPIRPASVHETAPRAVGDVTHLLAGLTFGTLSAHGIQMAADATGASLSLVTEDAQIGD